jgi:hypothetical protein
MINWTLSALHGEADWHASLWNKRMPTLIGLGLVSIGTILGSLLVKNPNLHGLAQTSLEPRQVKVTNFAADGFSVSWLTEEPMAGFIQLVGADSTVFLDDRAANQTTAVRTQTHHVTARGLDPETTYYFKIGSGGQLYTDNNQPFQATTTKKEPEPNQADPAYGQVLTRDGDPAADAIVYATLRNGTTLSTLVSDQGTWLVALNRSWTTDLSSPLSYPNRGAHLSLVIEGGSLGRSVGEVLTGLDEPVPAVTLGENFSYLDLSQAPPEELPPPALSPAESGQTQSPDLNEDGLVNTSDLGLLRQAIDQKSTEARFDLNGDGLVNDLDAQVILDNWGKVK